MLELTTAQAALLDGVSEEYLELLVTPSPYDVETVRQWLAIAYDCCAMAMPERVEIVDSPFAAFDLASQLTGFPVASLDGSGISDAPLVARYDALFRLGILSKEECSKVFALKGFLQCAWDHILLDECAIVVRRPTTLNLDAEEQLHSVDGPALAWGDGHAEYAHHGTWISERIALTPRTYTREQYLAISSTEVRRAVGERGGWDWVAQLLGATVVDAWTDPNTRLGYELLAYDGGKLLRKQSPTEPHPWYCEPVHEDLTTAKAARKWQATDLSPADCERDPELTYGVEV